MDTRNQFSQRAPALCLLPGLIAGLLVSRIVPANSLTAGIALGLAILAWWLANQDKGKLWLLAFAASSLLGFWAYGTERLPRSPGEEWLSVPPREAIVVMKIDRVMQPGNRFGSSAGIARVISASETSRLEEGSLLYFRLSKQETAAVEILRGLTIRATGVLYPISENVSTGSFDAYLRETGIFYRLQQTRDARVVKDASAFKKLCHHTNQRFQEILRLGEPEDRELSQIYVAMLLGKKAELSPDQSDRFRSSGTMHLFAISGLHIGVIATVIWQVLLLFRIPAKYTPFAGLPLLYFYVEVTGAAPSAVRAFLMVAFFWAGMAVQRQRTPLAALAASAVFVLIIQPSQLWQMGFQLSYLVVISILLFGLPLRERLWTALRPNKYLPESSWSRSQRIHFWLSDKIILLFAISFSAWLASTPLSAGFFGYIAPYAIVVNILLVNLAALVISTGVISLAIASLGLEAMAAFLNHSSWLGLAVMDALVRLNLALPSATVPCPGFPQSISYLAVLAYVCSLISMERIRNNWLRFGTPPAIVLFGLLSGLLLAK